MFIKKITFLPFCFLLLLFLCGCYGYVDIENLIHSPSPNMKGENIPNDLKLKLDAYYGEEKEIIQYEQIKEVDYDCDGNMDIVSLYRSSKSNYSYFISFYQIDEDGKLTKATTIIGYGSQIKDFLIEDLDGNFIPEIIVGYSAGYYIKNGLSIYRFRGSYFEEIFTDAYDALLVDDLNNDFKKEVFLLKFSDLGMSTAEIYQFTKEGFVFIDDSKMEASPKRIIDIKIGNAAESKKAVFVDMQVGANASYTDVFVVEEGYLVNVFFDYEKKMTTKTYRPNQWESKDIDGDGIVEIPLIMERTDKFDVTKILWASWDGLNGLLEKKYEIYLSSLELVFLPSKEEGELMNFETIKERNCEKVLLYYFDPFTGEKLEITSIIRCTKPQWEQTKKIENNNYEILAETPLYIYLQEVLDKKEFLDYRFMKFRNTDYLRSKIMII